MLLLLRLLVFNSLLLPHLKDWHALVNSELVGLLLRSGFDLNEIFEEVYVPELLRQLSVLLLVRPLVRVVWLGSLEEVVLLIETSVGVGNLDLVLSVVHRLEEILVHLHSIIFGCVGLVFQEELLDDYLELLDVVIEVSLGVKALGENGQEIVDPGGLELGSDGTDSYGFFVYHFHDLPLFPIFTGSTIHRASKVALAAILVLLRQIGFNYHLRRVIFVLPNAVQDLVPHTEEVSLSDYFSERTHNLLVVRHILLPLFILVLVDNVLLIRSILTLDVMNVRTILSRHAVHVLGDWVALLGIGDEIPRHVDQVLKVLVTDALSKAGAVVDHFEFRFAHVVVSNLVQRVKLIPVNLVRISALGIVDAKVRVIQASLPQK